METLSTQFLWTDSLWEALGAPGVSKYTFSKPSVCGDGCEVADAFTQSLFLTQGKTDCAQGGVEDRKGTEIRIVTVVDVFSPRMTVIAQASTGGQRRPGSKVIPCLSNLLLQGDPGIS